MKRRMKGTRMRTTLLRLEKSFEQIRNQQIVLVFVVVVFVVVVVVVVVVVGQQGPWTGWLCL